LALAVKAHGGVERWDKIKSVKIAASITEAIWYLKGKPDYLKNVVMTADAKSERALLRDYCLMALILYFGRELG
jgi:hypothetical protein